MAEFLVLGFYNTIVAGGIGGSAAVVREGLAEFVRKNLVMGNPMAVYSSLGISQNSEPFVRSLLLETGIEIHILDLYLGSSLKQGLYDLIALSDLYGVPVQEMTLIGCDRITRDSAKAYGSHFIAVPSLTAEILDRFPESDFMAYADLYRSLPSRFSFAGLDLNARSRDYVLFLQKDKA